MKHAALAALLCGASAAGQIEPQLRSRGSLTDPHNDAPIHHVSYWAIGGCGSRAYDDLAAALIAERGEAALAPLLQGLTSRDPGRRDGSVEALARMGAPAVACLRTLVDGSALCDPPPASSERERRELVDLMDEMAVERFQELPSPPGDPRHGAALALAAMVSAAPSPEGRAEAVRSSVAMLWDDDDVVRDAAVSGLASAEEDAALATALAEVLLREPSRRSALDAMLAVMGDTEPSSAAATALLSLVAYPDVEIRCRALAALPRIHLPPDLLLAFVAAAAYDPDPLVRLEALQLCNAPGLALAAIGPLLRDGLSDPEPLLRFVALRSLGAALLREPALGVRPAHVADVLRAMQDPAALVALRAAEVLARLAATDGTLLLAARRTGGDHAREAARILADIGPAGAPRMALLRDAARAEDPGIRADALWRLGKIRPRSSELAALLASAAQDADESVRYAAREALASAD